jgi:hypothetical protein
MYVCMYVCMHVCMYACMYVCMYVCMCVYMYVCMCVCVCMYVCMCVYMYICVYVYEIHMMITNYLSEWQRVKSEVHKFLTKFRNPLKILGLRSTFLAEDQKMLGTTVENLFSSGFVQPWGYMLHVTCYLCILSRSDVVRLAILCYSVCLLSWGHCGLSHSVNFAFLIYSFFLPLLC